MRRASVISLIVRALLGARVHLPGPIVSVARARARETARVDALGKRGRPCAQR
jgi:hypothetical protein